MIYSLYVIFDKLAKQYGSLFDSINVGCAIRHFKSILLKNSVSAKDLELYCVGTYDTSTGKIVLNSELQVVADFGCLDLEGD